MRGCGNTNGLGKQSPPEAVPHLHIPSSPHPRDHSLVSFAANPPPGANFSATLSADVTVRRAFT